MVWGGGLDHFPRRGSKRERSVLLWKVLLGSEATHLAVILASTVCLSNRVAFFDLRSPSPHCTRGVQRLQGLSAHSITAHQALAMYWGHPSDPNTGEQKLGEGLEQRAYCLEGLI